MAAEPTIRITVAWSSGPRQAREESLHLPQGSTVAQALQAWALARGGQEPAQAWAQGIWGERVEGGQVLCEGDRLELYRPLQVDPKLARRMRFQAQGARAAGLFARRKAGAKPGY